MKWTNEDFITIGVTFLLIIFFFVYPKGFVFVGTWLFSPLYEKVSVDVKNVKIDSTGVFVLSGPPQQNYDYILFKTSQKVEVGSFVRLKGDVVIGEVINFNEATDIGRAVLFSSPDIKNKVSIRNYVGETVGLGGGSFYVEIPKNIEVEVGDEIILQKRGVLLGLVEKVEETEDKINKKVYSRLRVNIFQLTKVELFK